ncbi:hypothetical protein Bca101_060971 [Brassica carinata]
MFLETTRQAPGNHTLASRLNHALIGLLKHVSEDQHSRNRRPGHATRHALAISHDVRLDMLLGSVSPSGTGNDHSNYRNLQQNESGSSVPLGGIYALPSENVFPERPGQPECRIYMKTGDCKFGTVCKFHHPRDRQAPPPDCLLSPIGLPLRLGEPLCVFYSRYGICKFGPSCKFHHPTGAFTETDEVVETSSGHSRRVSVSETRQATTTASGQDSRHSH